MHVILAPSSAGKSWFVLHNDGLGDFGCLIDGDAVVSQYVGWPKEAKWWEDATLSGIVHQRNCRSIRTFASKRPDALVFFNGDMSSDPGLVGAVVIPPLQVVKRNMSNKAARGSDQPIDPATITENVAAIRSFASRSGIPEFTTFESAVRHLRSRRLST